MNVCRGSIHLLALLSVAFLAGCGGRSPSAHRAAPVAASPATSPATAPANAPATPVLYMPDGVNALSPITAAQRRELELAAQRVRPGAAVWFFLVTFTTHDARAAVVAEVYYVPEEQTPKLRRGTWVKLFIGSLETFDPEDVEFHKYAQVSPADRPFGKTLDVPQPGIFLPIRDGGFAKNDERKIALVQAFYAAVQRSPHRQSALDQRILHFGQSHGQDEVYYGYCETVGEFIGFEYWSDGTYHIGHSGTWAF